MYKKFLTFTVIFSYLPYISIFVDYIYSLSVSYYIHKIVVS
uniref:Phage protein n=1 Tax=Heterorhabditis bacteriophora TaxID=37862 RepID=A0A1I7WQ03_HETBA